MFLLSETLVNSFKSVATRSKTLKLILWDLHVLVFFIIANVLPIFTSIIDFFIHNKEVDA